MFITLTIPSTVSSVNTEVRININKIVAYFSFSDGSSNVLFGDSESSFYHVIESSEQIDNLIREVRSKCGKKING